jgi:hypothetical protein
VSAAYAITRPHRCFRDLELGIGFEIRQSSRAFGALQNQ